MSESGEGGGLDGCRRFIVFSFGLWGGGVRLLLSNAYGWLYLQKAICITEFHRWIARDFKGNKIAHSLFISSQMQTHVHVIAKLSVGNNTQNCTKK